MDLQAAVELEISSIAMVHLHDLLPGLVKQCEVAIAHVLGQGLHVSASLLAYFSSCRLVAVLTGAAPKQTSA